MKPEVPPAVGTPAPSLAPINFVCLIEWKPGHVQAELAAESPTDAAHVLWSGNTDRIDAPPATQMDATLLAAWMEDQAERTGGTFTQRQEAPWPVPDEVKG